MWLSHYSTLARYNQWQNQQHYQLCDRLDDTQRKADRGLFFHSIHGTLNHLLLADRLWLGRFLDRPFHVQRLDQELYEDFDQLWRERENTDQAILDYIAGLEESRLDGELSYVSASTGQSRSQPLRLCLTHFFNHQTHHRGQITTAYGQLGHDVGVTDLIFMPSL
ncbi:DinB family protein [Alloalcanivorax dieselolei B5]|uniref:DinB family protein n=1 Tax=Alcanivorax dieselolei (strain DSM 16502 / CGMCC 1.3690 / MCCC 1A00001 / B-5) TaxID=930169 RepID=K0CFX9_ALCDB|nr:DinB family protein [Alloalcanivorax dieselolei]AFT71548.1 DinB family protein [Alloalcanivorax dieselolei B5]GGJ90024.1 damage-inducible protein DinB [Alloalcanivorax dieselolei]